MPHLLQDVTFASIPTKCCNNTMHEMRSAEELLEIRQPFDGSQPEIEEGEQLAAALAFEQLSEDLMLRHMAYVGTKNYYSGKDSQTSEALLLLEIPASDGSKLEILVATAHDTSDDGSPIPLDVKLMPFDARRRVREALVCYQLSSDRRRVTRYDAPRSENPGKAQPFLGHSAVAPDFTEATHNRDLERDMGLNDQPVGPDEIEKLKQLLGNATPKSRR